MNRSFYPQNLTWTALALAALLVAPARLRAQSGNLLVSPQTGLELDNPSAPKPADKKSKAADPVAEKNLETTGSTKTKNKNFRQPKLKKTLLAKILRQK